MAITVFGEISKDRFAHFGAILLTTHYLPEVYFLSPPPLFLNHTRRRRTKLFSLRTKWIFITTQFLGQIGALVYKIQAVCQKNLLRDTNNGHKNRVSVPMFNCAFMCLWVQLSGFWGLNPAVTDKLWVCQRIFVHEFAQNILNGEFQLRLLISHLLKMPGNPSFCYIHHFRIYFHMLCRYL